MPPVINQEWLNQNSLRSYPFREDMSMVPHDVDTGAPLSGVQIPNYLLVDFILSLPGNNVTVYLSQMALAGNLITLVFSNESDIRIATLAITLDAHTPYSAYDIIGQEPYQDARGRVVLGNLEGLRADLADGIYNFTSDTTRFEPATVRPDIRGVRSLRLINGDDISQLIQGRVKLISGTNIRLVYDANENAIIVNAIAGEGLNDECDCAGKVGESNIVRTINGIPIEDVILVGDGKCVDINPEGNRLVISDSCSQPCCSCPELEFLTDSLKILEVSLTNLESYAQQLNLRISTFVNNYILTLTT